MFRRAALLGLVAAAGCGYRADVPQSRGPVGARPVNLVVAAREERNAQLLRDFLDVALQSAGVTERIQGVALQLNLATQELAIRRDETPGRARLIATIRYVASRRVAEGPEPEPLRGTVRLTEGYNFIDTEFFATDTAREAAERRLMEAAANQIATRLWAATL